MRLILKNLLFGSEPGPRTIRRGLLRRLQFHIDPGNASLRLLGFSERELCGLVRQWSHEVRTAIDIGANDGWYTVYFATRPGIESVIACEPDPACLSALQANLDLNKSFIKAKVSIVPSFIGSSPACEGVSRLPLLDLPPDNHGQITDNPALASNLQPSIFPPPSSFLPSPLAHILQPSTLDSLLADTTGPYLIKIDVEGAELDVLRSGAKSLQALDCRLIVETHSEQLEHDCIEFLQQLGYECQVIPNGWYRRFIPEHRSLPHNRWLSARKAKV